MVNFPMLNNYKAVSAKTIHTTKPLTEESEYTQPPPDETAQKAVTKEKSESLNSATLTLSGVGIAKSENKIVTSGSSPSDNSGALTKRLVSAKIPFEVRQVISEASNDLTSLLAIAASDNSKDADLAKQYIKKLEKLISRAGRKIDDLDSEEMLRINKLTTERKKQRERAAEIKAELLKKQREREKRENSYLYEELHENILGVNGGAGVHVSAYNTASEAAIVAQAEVMATAEISTNDSGGSDGGASDGTGAAVSVDSGIEISTTGGGTE